MCMDFLISMEENTDGSLSVNKAFAADGDMALDSDEAVAKSAVKLAKKKRERGGFRNTSSTVGAGMNKKRKLMSKVGSSPKPTEGTGTESLADPAFVAVLLNSQQTVSRVFDDDDDDNL